MTPTRRQFTLGALASTALTATGLAANPRPALAASHTAYVMTDVTDPSDDSATHRQAPIFRSTS